MKECGVYRVSGRRAFRGHEQGEEFVAELEPAHERRAIYRGSIERLGTVVLQPENYTFPEGWIKED